MSVKVSQWHLKTVLSAPNLRTTTRAAHLARTAKSLYTNKLQFTAGLALGLLNWQANARRPFYALYK